jgi:hypothetical protein
MTNWRWRRSAACSTRYRKIARHGMVTERDEIDEITEAEEPPALSGR